MDKKTILKISAIIIVSFGVGFFGGMEYKAYQIRSGLKEAIGEISEIFTSETQQEKKKGEILPNKLKEKIDAELVDKGFIASDYDDYITINLRFENKTDKDINGIHGEIIFYDIFDNEIYQSGISYDDGIVKGDSAVWKGQIKYNQFRDDHKKLRNTELENLKYEWLPDTIIYQDGSKETE